ncbi:MAG: DUF2281 domain-containing protein [Chloroflexota bacterium]
MLQLAEIVKELPPPLQQEVEDFAMFLWERRVRKPREKFKLDWRGALQDLKNDFTSVELQHKALEWWGGLDAPS